MCRAPFHESRAPYPVFRIPLAGADTRLLVSVTLGLRPAKGHEKTPHPTSSLGHLLPREKAEVIFPLRGEAVAEGRGRMRGQFAMRQNSSPDSADLYPHLRLDTRGVVRLEAPTGRANTAQAEGLGPVDASRLLGALKGRDRNRRRSTLGRAGWNRGALFRPYRAGEAISGPSHPGLQPGLC